MGEPLKFYERTLRLPFDDLERGKEKRASLDRELESAQHAAREIAPDSQVTVERGEDGQFAARATRGPLQMFLSGRYGRNTAFEGHQRVSFVSYAIDARVTCSTVERAEVVGSHISLLGKIWGAALGALAMVAAVWGLHSLIHHILHWTFVFVATIGFGIWCGGKIGDTLALRLESAALRQVAPELEQFDNMWDLLVARLKLINATELQITN